ncbi:SCO2523 family variant P-loop protein [Nocardia stercoris]|uniref:ParA family protein n=1 Tax=Nocardia stercoris TaxID=2483361 RepID=A0A3M2LCE4_9NOCA|nr:SCO2523 family variant P-loop protein [Nocardia stercoris]RMI33645.1 ParA family protein [Nocardia stercoris]
MLVFSTSDKGGTGRSVTSANLAYRLCLTGRSVAYVDFDFGSPTAGALFEISNCERGLPEGGGTHSNLLGNIGTIVKLDIGAHTSRAELRRAAPRLGRLALVPGDEGGAEFLECDEAMVKRCHSMLNTLNNEFKVVIVDLSAGRSAALELVLRATAQMPRHTARWLIFHRWTRQHIIAANGLVYGPNGLLALGSDDSETSEPRHSRADLLATLRFVRVAYGGDGTGEQANQHPAQAAWLKEQNSALKRMASANKLGETTILGFVPREPILQWREQIILDSDVNAYLANRETARAYTDLARRLVDPATWELA